MTIDHSHWYEVGKWRCDHASIYFGADYSSFTTTRDGNILLMLYSWLNPSKFLCFQSNKTSWLAETFILYIKVTSLYISQMKIVWFFFQVERVASMLNYFLLQLVGPQRKSLSLKDPEKYEFRPKLLLKQVGITVNVTFFYYLWASYFSSIWWDLDWKMANGSLLLADV